jgi:hypothetical protein
MARHERESAAVTNPGKLTPEDRQLMNQHPADGDAKGRRS